VSGPVDGVPVVAVHGWPDSPRAWNAVVSPLEAAGCRVYRPYLRGFGPTRFRDADARRTGQIAALCLDLSELVASLGLERPVLAGHDWGARAAYAVAAAKPELLSGLVVMSVAYASSGPGAEVSAAQAHAYWYQWYFSTGVGRRALERDRDNICRYLWKQWSPSFDFDDEEFGATATAWENPDWSAITVHSYTQRWGGADGDPHLDELERRLADKPPIGVPTIVLHGDEDGAALVSATENQEGFFTSTYERRTLPGVGHFVPREAPRDAANAIIELAHERG
jgi:pimeloyl-ACP methyl ester carboxylesterase